MTEKASRPFAPEDHLRCLKCGKATLACSCDVYQRPYLETKWRLVWLREKYPPEAISIETDIVAWEPAIVIKATAHFPPDGVRITAFGSAKPESGKVYSGREVEKAETAAVGRLCAMLGFGTQFTEEDDTEHLADSPNDVGRRTQRRPTSASSRPTAPSGGKERSAPPSTATAPGDHWSNIRAEAEAMGFQEWQAMIVLGMNAPSDFHVKRLNEEGCIRQLKAVLDSAAKQQVALNVAVERIAAAKGIAPPEPAGADDEQAIPPAGDDPRLDEQPAGVERSTPAGAPSYPSPAEITSRKKFEDAALKHHGLKPPDAIRRAGYASAMEVPDWSEAWRLLCEKEGKPA
jgi:hypothetical protein